MPDMPVNPLLLHLLEEEEEEDDLLIELLLMRGDNKRAGTNDLFLTRFQEGYYKVLFENHLLDDEEKFREFLRFNNDQFFYILNMVRHDLELMPSNRVARPISAEEKLAVTLRFLATGESQASLAFGFRIHRSYISRIIETCLTALARKLPPIFLPTPTKESLQQQADDFKDKWQFPNCCAAIDGKHIRMKSPPNSGSLFYNFHEFFSIVLLAVVDANYKFVIVDVGSYGKEGDSGIFEKSALGRQLSDPSFYPADATLPGSNIVAPFVTVGDEAFRLRRHMMKPYSKPEAKADIRKGRYNYRLCRARRVSENSFALLAQVFRVFYTPICLKVETCEKLVIVACCLHNMLRSAFLESSKKPRYNNNRREPPPMQNLRDFTARGGFGQLDGHGVRENFVKYFSSAEGKISWQDDKVLITDG